jgi:hypothetical protein
VLRLILKKIMINDKFNVSGISRADRAVNTAENITVLGLKYDAVFR